jgi:hypothetical protein
VENNDKSFGALTSTMGFLYTNGHVAITGKTASAVTYGPIFGLGFLWNAYSVNDDLDGRKITVYYPYFPNGPVDYTNGTTLTLTGYETPESYRSNAGGTVIATKTLTTTVDNAAGKIYSLNF